MRGLEIFKKHFSGYENNYVLIGGTACMMILEDIGSDFRATKDLDIVLIIEKLDREFVNIFWDFIKSGKYENRFIGKEKGRFYRFEKPGNRNYPAMIELFSRKPDDLEIEAGVHLIPLNIAYDISSLSAILLNDDYYDFLRSGIKIIDGVPVLDEIHLIPFKAKAWCDLRDRQGAGQKGLTKHIIKHLKDITLLSTLIIENTIIKTNGEVYEDMKRFLKEIEKELSDNNFSQYYYNKLIGVFIS